MKNEVKNYPEYILNNTYVVFTIETTGLNIIEDDIIQISAVKLVNGKITEEFNSFCKPNKKVPKEITALTGITNKMLQNKDKSIKVVQNFLNFAKGATLVSYNVRFDYSFIKSVLYREGITIDNQIYDCLTDAKNKLLFCSNYKLSSVANKLKLSTENVKGLLNEAKLIAKIFLALSLL